MIKPLNFEEIKNIYRWVLKSKWAVVIENNEIILITKNGFRVKVENLGLI